MMKSIIIATAFNEVLNVLKKKGKKYIDRNLNINKYLKEIGYENEPEDNYPSLYIHTLIRINEIKEFKEFIELLNEQEVFESFKKADIGRNRELFERILDGNLHTNPKYLNLKKYDSVPSKLIDSVFEIFEECRKIIQNPKETYFLSENSKEHNKTRDEIANLRTEMNLISSRLLQKVPSGKEIVLTDKLNRLYKDKIDQIFKEIKDGKIDSGLKNLIHLNDEIKEDVEIKELKNSVFKKIAYCYLEKKDFSNSAHYYEEALKYKNDPGTLSTLSLIYNHINDEVNFIRVIFELEKINPQKAEITKIRFGKSSKHTDQYYESFLNEEIKDEETLLALVQYFAEIKDYKRAFEIGDRLIQIFNKIEYKEFTSGFGIQYLQYRGIHMGLNYIANDERELFKQGLKYIQDCSNFYKGKEIENYKEEIFANRSIYETWNENNELALEYIDYAISLDKDNYQLYKIKGVVYTKKKEYNKAIECFNKIPSDIAELEDVSLLKSICYFVEGENEQAINILEKSLKEIKDFDIRQRTLEQLINYYFLFDKLESVKSVFNEYINFCSEPYRKLIQAKILNFEGKINEGKFLLDDLKKELLITKEFSPLVPDLGSEFERINEYNSVIELYEIYANYYEDTFFIKSLYDLYLKTGKLNKVLEICQAQRKTNFHKFYTRNEIAILNGLHDHDNIIDLGVKYLNEFPQEVETRLYVIHSLLKRDKKNEALNYLNYPFIIKELNESNSGNLLDCYLKLNLLNQAFETAYALLAYNDNAFFNDLYMKVNIFNDKHLTNLKTDRVSNNTSVTINENGEFKVLTYVNSESDIQIIEYFNEVQINDPKYYKLFERKVGEKISFVFNKTHYNIEILEIKHKYIFAFHKALKKCGTSYKSESIFKMFDASSLNSGQLPEFIKTSLQESVKNSQTFDDFLKLYETGKIPLMSIAIFNERQFIDVWNFCKLSNDHFIRTCSGKLEEMEEINSILANSKANKLLFDISSLLLFYSIGIIDFIKEHFDLYVIQDVIDHLELYVEINKIGAENESSILGSYRGKNILIKKTSEQKQEELREIRIFINWIKANFQIQSPEVLLKIHRQELNEYIEVLGSIAAKSLIISSRTDVLFLCEDMALRNISISEFNKPAIWTQSIIFHLTKKELLEPSDYNCFIRKILEQNVLYTHINSEVLFDGFLQNDFKINNVNIRFFNILRGNQSDNSALIVGFGFLKKLWKTENIDIELKRRLTFELLFSFFIYRCSKDTAIQIQILLNTMFRQSEILQEIENQLISLSKYIRIFR